MSTKQVFFEYQVMLFGLCNTLASFWGYINKILSKKLNIFIIIYLDNILLYMKDFNWLYMEAVCLITRIIPKI